MTPNGAARYESHPGRALADHLRDVAEGARDRLDHPALRCRELLREAAWCTGLSHDIGKYTTFFQRYLHERRRAPGSAHFHAFPSAVFAAWLLRERLPGLPGAEGDEPLRSYLPLLGYLAVHRHHGHLRAPETLVPRSRQLRVWPESVELTGEDRRAFTALRRQMDDLRAHRDEIVSELEGLGVPEAGGFLGVDVPGLFRGLERLQRSVAEGELPEDEGARLCLWGQLLFSALLDADKLGAAGVEAPGRASIPSTVVDDYVEATFPAPGSGLDRARADLYAVARRQAEEVDLDDPPVLSLTAPTGLGKTLAAFSAAMRLRERLERRWGVAPRVVYALPFINLIEQNYGVLERVLGRLPAFPESPERFLLRHHHLAEVRYRPGGHEEELPVDQALLLTEAWESEVVVTTFVQVFHTLLGHQNRFLKKLHNLIGAVVVLDEPQSLPMEHWGATGRVFAVLRRELGMVPLQMTATRPLIFPEHQELYPGRDELFRLQRRTTTEVDLEQRSVDDLAREVREISADSSVLVVVNTVRSSLELYDRLRELGAGQPYRRVPAWPDGPGGRSPAGRSPSTGSIRRSVERSRSGLLEEEAAAAAREWGDAAALVYLSTNIVPLQRRDRLAFVRSRLGAGERVIVVATQVVEAGVDLDFPVVVRDLGPLESIVQVAGRCNREGRLAGGRVLLRPLDDPGTARIYGAVHLHVVRRLLEGRERIEEPEYAALVERYFREVQERKSQQTGRDLWGAYTRLWYDWGEPETAPGPALSDFPLIPPLPDVPIFVALRPEEEAWFQEEFVPEVLEPRDFAARRDAYVRHRARLHAGMIRPLLQRAKENLPPTARSAEEEGALRWVPGDQLESYYDRETGFRWRADELAGAWIE